MTAFTHDAYFTKTLADADPDVFKGIQGELGRQKEQIELIASENIVSQAVLDAQGSVLTNKYAEGYPGRRYYGGCEFVDITEDLARERAKKLFGAAFANVQPHSGAQANQAVFFTLLQPGDALLLCTDGVWEALSGPELAGFLKFGSLEEGIEEMLFAVENRMKQKADNLSAIGLRWEDAVTTSPPLQPKGVRETDHKTLIEDMRIHTAEKKVQANTKPRAKTDPKASLEASVRYLATQLGARGIRVNAISAGPIRTLAASGIKSFHRILEIVERNAPLKRNVTIDDVGNVAAFLLSDLAAGVTAEITYVDAGFSQVMGGAPAGNGD